MQKLTINLRTMALILISALSLTFIGCDDESCRAGAFGVGGDITGLDSGESIELSLNDGEAVQTFDGDNYIFVGVGLDDCSEYTVTIATQPDGKTCTLQNASGTIRGEAALDVHVTCN